MKLFFPPLLAYQSLSVFLLSHCNIFYGFPTSPLLKNLLSTTCGNVLYRDVCSDHKVGRLPFSQNNNAVFHPTQSTSGLSAARFFSFLLILCTITQSFSQPNTFIARFSFCVSSLSICFTGVGKTMPLQLIPSLTGSVWIFSFWWGKHS